MAIEAPGSSRKVFNSLEFTAIGNGYNMQGQLAMANKKRGANFHPKKKKKR